ncbi:MULTISPECIES: LysR family transcriptional regulator [unclassified Pseudomonas]|uniref:LysR family transcriptional regulator n=1 Tax=unclassified Pseudomonas TaxID=196821 RepID=UPI0035C084B5
MFQDELGSLAAFVAVAEAQSFTRAAGRLGTSQSALSHKLKRLEDRLGIRLLTRTTRSVSLTEAGERLLETLKPALEEITSQLATLTDIRDKPAGTIRITSADHVAETILWPALNRLLPEYPDIQVEVSVDNGFVDIVADRYDAGIRLGENLDKDMIAVPIGPAERCVVVGSPTYLAKYSVPTHPDQLSKHRCINRRFPSSGGISAWYFEKDGQQHQVRVTGQVAFNRPEMILEAALSGFGLAMMLDSQVTKQVKTGRLVRVLDQWCPEFPGYYLYYPSRRQTPPAFQLIVDSLRYQG